MSAMTTSSCKRTFTAPVSSTLPDTVTRGVVMGVLPLRSVLTRRMARSCFSSLTFTDASGGRWLSVW
jgi:hypothetical protein